MTSLIIRAGDSRYKTREIPVVSFKAHCRADVKWIGRQGLSISSIRAVFDGLESGPFLGYVIKCRSSYIGVSIRRGDRYTRLTHKTIAPVINWLKTGKEV